MNSIYLPGFGDEATWPACTGRANDPRYEPDEGVDARIYAIEEAERLLALARGELCNMPPDLLKVDALMADAMGVLK